MPTSRWWVAAVWIALAASAWGQTFGQVVALGGHSADLVLDEPRSSLYVANFTANRIDIISTESGAFERSINVASQPSTLSLSPDGKYLVVGHYGNFLAPNTPRNAITVIELETRSRQTFSLVDPPFGVAFGSDGLALVVTSKQFLLFDPALGTLQPLDTIANVAAKTLPQPPATFPTEIVGASIQASGDLSKVYGVTDNLLFSYDVATKNVTSGGYVASPPLGPRAISVARDGAYYLAGWVMFDRRGALAQFANPLGLLNVGSHAIDSDRGIVYAQIPSSVQTAGTSTGGTTSGSSPLLPPPIFMVADADNLRVRERLHLPENLAGKGILSSDGMTMYALSESGVMILPVGNLQQVKRVVADQEDLVFRSSFCSPGLVSKEFTVYDPSGGKTDFSISTATPGIRISPSAGTTPATVTVSIDPSSFINQRGTISADLILRTTSGVNVPKPVRVLLNLQDPDQRGTFVNVPGKLVDMVMDEMRNRFFVLRQDTNEVIAFDGSNYQEIARLRTGNTPMSLAITFDRRYLLVGNDNSQYANVYDLETLEQAAPIRFPFGHYPRYLASSGNATLAATRVAGPKNKIDRVDFENRIATELPTLGVYENDIHIDTALVASDNGGSIMAAMADGSVMLYNASADTFTISRKDFNSLSGAVAASIYDQFVIGNTLFNSSLVPEQQFDNSVGLSSGFAFVDDIGLRSGALSQSNPGLIQRVDLQSGTGSKSTRMVEAPVLGSVGSSFTRTIAALPDRSNIINLTTSGFTVLAWNYDAAMAIPLIDRVVNAADKTKAVAPGALIVVEGRNLAPVNSATQQIPLPVALAESCLMVNGLPVPMLMVSSTQINAQLPFQLAGTATMVLRTPGGVSDNYNLAILPTAPSVFRTSLAPNYEVPTVVRSANGQVVTASNPIRSNDALAIYLTGMGKTNPEIEAGAATPADAPVVITNPTVDIGGVALPVEFAGLVPGEVGVYQIRVSVPHTVPKGMGQTLRVKQGGYSSAVQVRVID